MLSFERPGFDLFAKIKINVLQLNTQGKADEKLYSVNHVISSKLSDRENELSLFP